MTIDQRSHGDASTVVSEKDVADYLNEHPNFFNVHPETLALVEVAHQTPGAVSLIERQVAVLRQQNKQLRGRIKELAEIARDNDTLIAKLHRLSMELIKCTSLDNYIEVLVQGLEENFAADAASVRLIADVAAGSRAELVGRTATGWNLFESILARRKPVCGRFNAQQLEFLFGSRAELIKSVAVVPIADMQSLGLIVVGSADPERFRAGMSTAYLCYLGEMAYAVLQRLR